MTEQERIGLVLTEWMSQHAVEWLGDDVRDDERCVIFADAVKMTGDRKPGQTLLQWVGEVVKAAKLVEPSGWAGWINRMCDVRDETLLRQQQERQATR